MTHPSLHEALRAAAKVARTPDEDQVAVRDLAREFRVPEPFIANLLRQYRRSFPRR